jgi:hypothetical protein
MEGNGQTRFRYADTIRPDLVITMLATETHGRNSSGLYADSCGSKVHTLENSLERFAFRVRQGLGRYDYLAGSLAGSVVYESLQMLILS